MVIVQVTAAASAGNLGQDLLLKLPHLSGKCQISSHRLKDHFSSFSSPVAISHVFS